MASTFKVDVTTKLHRIMRHVKNQLTSHGCTRRCSTEENELENKKFKPAYNKTNRHMEIIGVQLLRAHVHSDEVDVSNDSENEHDDSNRGIDDAHTPCTTWTTLLSKVVEMIRSMCGLFHPHQVSDAVLDLTFPDTNNPCFRKVKSLKLSLSLVPFAKNLKHKTIYAGGSVYGARNCHDCIELINDFRPTLGIVECIIAPNSSAFNTNRCILVIRLLKCAEPDLNNSSVVMQYVNKRYKYSLSDTFHIKTVAIQGREIVKAVILVVDPYWAKLRFGLETRIKDVPDDDDTRCEIHFFHVKGYPLTSGSQVKGSNL